MADELSKMETRRPPTTKCLALLYHDVVPPGQFASSGFSGADADAYKFERPEFERHLQAIFQRSGGSKTTALKRASDPLSGRNLLLTFDDAGASAPAIGEMLERFGWRGHFFVATDFVGKPGFVNQAEIRDLHSRGHAIGSHSCSHPMRMALCSASELKREWNDSIKALSDILGESVRLASVPGGYYSIPVAEEAGAAGIEVLFNSEPTTRPQWVSDVLVVGRFSIRQGVSAETAGALAAGSWRSTTQQYVFWTLKKFAKRLGGSYYLRLRKAVFEKTA